MTRWAVAGVLFMLLNVADAVLTAWAIETGHGEVREANPLMAYLIAWAGLWGFVAVKVSVGSILAACMVRLRSSALWWVVAAVGGVVGWNISQLMR